MTEKRLDRLLPALSAKERAILILRNFKAGRPQDRQLVHSAPDGQTTELSTNAPTSIYTDVKTLYEVRSPIVHGSGLTEKLAKVSIERVARSRGRSVPERYFLAIDRWRDILRRSILARIALESADTPWSRRGSEAVRISTASPYTRES